MAVHLWCIHDLARFGRAGGKSGQKGRQGASIALKWPVFWPLVNHRSTKQRQGAVGELGGSPSCLHLEGEGIA